MESEWQQVSSSLLDSYYSGRSQQCWMVPIYPQTSNYFASLSKPLETVPTATIPQLFYSLSSSKYLLCFTLSLIFTLWSAGKIHNTASLLFISQWSKGLDVWTGLVDLFVFQNAKEFYTSHSERADSGLCTYYLFVRSNFNFLHNSLWITHLTQSCLELYFLCTCLLHLLITWLIASSLSLNNLNLLFYCVVSISL